MANILKMAIIQAIERLHALRWSQRKIARELGVDPGTVSRYLRSLPAESKTAIPPAGILGPNAATFAGLPAPSNDGSGDSDCAADRPPSKPAIPPAGSGAADEPAGSVPAEGEVQPAPREEQGISRGRPGRCEPYRKVIVPLLKQGLSAQRIWQDLSTRRSRANRSSIWPPAVSCAKDATPC